MEVRDSRRGGIFIGLLLSATGIACVTVFAGIYLLSHVTIESYHKPGGSRVSIDTPAGNLSVYAHEKPGAVVAGVPVYPGATPRKNSGGDAVVKWTSNGDSGDEGFALEASDMVTTDPVDKVVDYYRRQLPNWTVVEEKGRGVHMELRKGGYKRIIGIREKLDGTHIGVASIGEPASN